MTRIDLTAANTTDVTNMTDAEFDALFDVADEPEQTWEEIKAESRAMRCEYHDAIARRSGYCRRGPNDRS